MKEAQEIVKDWLESLKEAYPHLPDNLPTDKEKENLLKLERWFKHIEELREYYDDVGKKELDEKYQDEPGRRQIIPVLMSLDDMSPEEVKAWHEMFICLAASMVHLSFGYWNTHNGQGDATLDLGDLLGYLPVVFLYVLSSYKPYPSDKRFSREHERVAYEKENDLTEKEIAKIDKSRIKLITWVYTESRRHINTYMQQIAYNIKYGSGYTHRLQQLILDIVNTYETDEGRYPTDEEVVTELRKTRYGKLLKKESLMKHVRFLKETKAGNYDTVSLYNPLGIVGKGSNDAKDVGDVIQNTEGDIEDFYDPASMLENKIKDNKLLTNAVAKLFYSNNQLTFAEIQEVAQTRDTSDL